VPTSTVFGDSFLSQFGQESILYTPYNFGEPKANPMQALLWREEIEEKMKLLLALS
jgi:hypothetical protein